MRTSSLRNILVISLSLPLLAVLGSAFRPKTASVLPFQPAVAATLASATDQSEPESRSLSDSLNPGFEISDTTDADGYRVLTFNELAGWKYYYPGEVLTFGLGINYDAPVEERLPPPILALDSQQISVTGFMIPIDGNEDGVTEFLLVRNMMICCYGVAPKMNEWIHIKTAEDKPVLYYRNVPVCVRGLFRIDEQVEQRYVAHLYRMIADDLESRFPKPGPSSRFLDRRFGR